MNDTSVSSGIGSSADTLEKLAGSGNWEAMEELYHAGKIKAIGVCNFLPDRLVDLILSHDIVPAVNQIELHPFCQQKELRSVMEKYDIQPMAWAPFAEGQNNITAIPKSVHEERIRQNYDVDDFELSEENMKKVEQMDTCSTCGNRSAQPPHGVTGTCTLH